MKIATTLIAAALTFIGAGIAHGATDAATRVYEGLLKSKPITMPRGFSSASTSAVRLNADDSRNGIIGAVEIDFAGAPAGVTARIRYAVFAQASDTTRYSEQVSRTLTARGVQRVFFPGFPGADCVASGQNQVCARASGDVFILAVSTGIASANTHEHQTLRGDSAGNVGRIALAYLQSVRGSIGQAGPPAPPSRSPIQASTPDPCAIMTGADVVAAMKSPMENPRRDTTGTCYYGSQTRPGEGVSLQLLSGGREQFDLVRHRMRGVMPLSGVGDAAFEFASAAGFIQIYALRGNQYFMLTFFERSAPDARRTAAALARLIATRIRG
jgi:hypothetical protein